MRTTLRNLTAAVGLILTAAPVRAGMPSPLPTEEDLVKVFRLNESAEQRLQVISFFLLGLLLSAAAVSFLWNTIRRDVPRLPRLTFGRARLASCSGGCCSSSS